MNAFLVFVVAGMGWIGPGPVMAEDQPGKCARAWWQPGKWEIDAESTHSFDVRLYRLDFDLPMYSSGYSCHEQACIKSNVPSLDTFSLDFAGLTCDSAKQQGTALVFAAESSRLWMALHYPVTEGDSTVVDVFFRRESTTANRGYFYGRRPATRYAHAMTCGCPFDTRYWFACWDLPHDKAERGCMTNLTVPDTFQTCANGVLDSVTSNAADGTTTWWWRHPYGIATYLMTFSASRFASWDTWHVNPGDGETIPIVHWMWPEDSAATRTGYQRLPDMFDYFTRPDVFGDYPFRQFGHVPGYYGFPWGAMEHQTLVMLHPTYIGGGRESTIAHELSHMWWGDMVTHVDHRDVWLNEGFATYAECMYMGHWQGRSYFQNYMRGKAQSAISQDRTWRFRIYDPPDLYNTGTIYSKGAWVQHMLRWVVGDTAWEQPGVFFEGLRAYGDSFRYGTTSTEDYCRVMEQVAGMELDWFFDEWIYLAGYPKYFLNASSEQVGDSFRVVTTLAQSNGQQAPDFFRTPLPVRFNCLYVDTIVVIRPQANPQVDTFMLFSCPESVTVDPDNWILDSTYLTGVLEPANVPRPPLRISVTPNPVRGSVRFGIEHATGETRLAIVDHSGRRVRSVVAGEGERSWTWDRCDDHGRKVGSGVYFVTVEGRSVADRHKLVLTD